MGGATQPLDQTRSQRGPYFLRKNVANRALQDARFETRWHSQLVLLIGVASADGPNDRPGQLTATDAKSRMSFPAVIERRHQKALQIIIPFIFEIRTRDRLFP